jgi:hypothetical protein
MTKYIPKIYAFYIPISIAIFAFIILAEIGHSFWIYILDLLKICIILMFSNYVLQNYKSEYHNTNPSMYFNIFAGLCFIEFIYKVWLYWIIDNEHYRYYSDLDLLFVIHAVILLIEFLSETIAINKLDSAFDDNVKKTWDVINGLIVFFFVVAVIFGGKALLIDIGIFCIIREVIRIHYILEFEKTEINTNPSVS